MRVVVVETVYHQAGDGPATSLISRFSRRLTTDEQPHSRRVAVDAEWSLLPTGWVADPSFVVVEHLKPLRPAKPSDQERADDASAVLEVSFGGGAVHALVPMGESLRFSPVDAPSVRLRCLERPARVNVTAFP